MRTSFCFMLVPVGSTDLSGEVCGGCDEFLDGVGMGGSVYEGVDRVSMGDSVYEGVDGVGVDTPAVGSGCCSGTGCFTAATGDILGDILELCVVAVLVGVHVGCDIRL